MLKLLAQRAKKNLVVTIHPLAENAYQFFRSQSFIVDKTKLGFSTIDSLLDGHLFSATQPGKEQCQLIGGFDVIGFSLHHINFERHNILVYEKMSDVEIERFAWRSVLRSLLSSIDTHQLEPIRTSLNNQAPRHIIQELFSANSLTQAQLAHIANISVSGLKKQKVNKAIHPPITTEIQRPLSSANKHIFERLVSEVKDEPRKD